MAQTALELGNFQAPGGAAGLGTLRVVEHHPQGTCGQTSVLVGLNAPIAGFAVLRLGIDCPCGEPYECYQISMSWRIADQPAAQPTVVVRFYATELLGNHPIRQPVMDTLALDQDLVWVSNTDPALRDTVLAAPIYETISTGTVTADGQVTVDVTASYNAAKAAGFQFFNCRLRITDDSPTDCLGGTTWYALVKAYSAVASQYNPVLLIGAGAGVGTTIGPIPIYLDVNDPEVESRGAALAHVRSRPDFAQNHQLVRVRRGNTVRVEVRVQDHWYQPPRQIDGTVYLTLTAEDGTVVLLQASLIRLDLGVYVGVYQTQETDPTDQVYLALVEFHPASVSRRGVSRAVIYYLLEGPYVPPPIPPEPPPPPVVTLVATIPDASKTGPVEGEFTIYRTGATTDPLTVIYAVGGTAVPDVDYEPLTGSATILAGESSVSFPVIPIPSSEPPPEVIITFSVTVDTASKVGLVEGEFLVCRTGDTSLDMVVTYTISGTAVPGVDYVELPGEVTIPAGESCAVIPVVPLP